MKTYRLKVNVITVLNTVVYDAEVPAGEIQFQYNGAGIFFGNYVPIFQLIDKPITDLLKSCPFQNKVCEDKVMLKNRS